MVRRVFGLGMMNEVEFATFLRDVLMKVGVGFCGDEKRGGVLALQH